ncbi:hypothetical protein RN001_004294 [Aquatica leii]|uniref:Uncharacterized protein n=1 Tax=Aquatica leii TaxID=1421715 RepID=A0AAN7P561_9COLE|nr:hypothetical protein RN001_004294 [Aquatica leii]
MDAEQVEVTETRCVDAQASITIDELVQATVRAMISHDKEKCVKSTPNSSTYENDTFHPDDSTDSEIFSSEIEKEIYEMDSKKNSNQKNENDEEKVERPDDDTGSGGNEGGNKARCDEHDFFQTDQSCDNKSDLKRDDKSTDTLIIDVGDWVLVGFPVENKQGNQILTYNKMFNLFVFCTFMLALQNAVAMTKKPIIQKSIMDDLFEEIDQLRKDVENSIISIIPDTKNVTKLLVASSKEFADSVERTSKSIRLHVKNAQGVVDNGVKEFTSKLTNSANKLKQLTNDAAVKTNRVATVIENQVKNILKDVQGAIQTNLLYTQDNVKAFTNRFFNDIITAGKRLQLDLSSCEQKPKTTS